MHALNAAMISAGASVAKLRAAAAEADKTLGGKVTSARALVDELQLLTAACERIATRMEGAQNGTRPRAPKRSAPCAERLEHEPPAKRNTPHAQ